MNADAELNSPVRGDARVALDHGTLDLDRAADRVDNSAELDDASVAGALDHTAMVHSDRGLDQIASKRSRASVCSSFAPVSRL